MFIRSSRNQKPVSCKSDPLVLPSFVRRDRLDHTYAKPVYLVDVFDLAQFAPVCPSLPQNAASWPRKLKAVSLVTSWYIGARVILDIDVILVIDDKCH